MQLKIHPRKRKAEIMTADTTIVVICAEQNQETKEVLCKITSVDEFGAKLEVFTETPFELIKAISLFLYSDLVIAKGGTMTDIQSVARISIDIIHKITEQFEIVQDEKFRERVLNNNFSIN